MALLREEHELLIEDGLSKMMIVESGGTFASRHDGASAVEMRLQVLQDHACCVIDFKHFASDDVRRTRCVCAYRLGSVD